MFNAKFSGTFLQQWRERQKKWAAMPKQIAAKIHLLDEPFPMDWWYYHEYGAAPHSITPKDATKIVYVKDGVTHVVDVAPHPGNKALHIVQNSMNAIAEKARPIIREALANHAADNPESLKEAIRKAAEEAKEIIALGYEQSLPGSRAPNPDYPRQAGKLRGATAAQVYREQAKIEDSSR